MPDQPFTIVSPAEFVALRDAVGTINRRVNHALRKGGDVDVIALQDGRLLVVHPDPSKLTDELRQELAAIANACAHLVPKPSVPAPAAAPSEPTK